MMPDKVFFVNEYKWGKEAAGCIPESLLSVKETSGNLVLGTYFICNFEYNSEREAYLPHYRLSHSSIKKVLQRWSY